VIAVDTNILVYAHRRDSTWHDAAYARITELSESRSPWCIPWSCLHEFFVIVTHPRIYSPPSKLEQAIDQVDAWLASPSLVMIAESDRYWRILAPLLKEARVTGPMVHDARIAGVCLLHGVRELWTADRDFGRFAELRVRNPLIA
jgi:toxin-antitoxin system PIN domain toxin